MRWDGETTRRRLTLTTRLRNTLEVLHLVLVSCTVDPHGVSSYEGVMEVSVLTPVVDIGEGIKEERVRRGTTCEGEPMFIVEVLLVPQLYLPRQLLL